MKAIASLLFTVIVMAFGYSCNRPGTKDLPDPQAELPPAKEGGPRTAVFAGGCFWCVEAVYEELAGVVEVESGYAGGTEDTADYGLVSSGGTDHAEAVRITWDPEKITYGQLLKVFFDTHDPTTLNRQGPDSGRQYRSAIFYASAKEKATAAAYIEQLTAAGVYPSPIVTALEPLVAFYRAEGYHQDFVEKNPDHPYVRSNALPKVEKVRVKYPDITK